MKIDNTTKVLFYPFYRRVGNPYQKVIRNINEFKKFIIENNGVRDCFIALYSERLYVDKLFFDLDILDLDLAGKFYKFLELQGFTPIPVFSGKKGFHFYVPLKPEKVTDRAYYSQLLRKVYFTIVNHSGLYSRDERNKKVSFFDTAIFGDLSRLTRVPNTLRPPHNRFYCTYLPPDFYKMSYEELFLHAKYQHEYDYEIIRQDKLSELEIDDSIHSFVCSNASKSKPIHTMSSVKRSIDKVVDIFLSMILRPCIYNMLIIDEPPHDIRAAATIDLLQFGFSIDDIVEIFSKLGWVDWNEDKTRYQVKHIAEHGYERYSCRYFKNMGYCIPDCDIPYKYSFTKVRQ